MTDAAIKARISVHQRAMATNPVYRAWYEQLLQKRQDRAARRSAVAGGTRRRDRRLEVLGELPMPRVYLTGPRSWRFVRDSQPDPDCWRQHVYDFTADVRELVCEPVQFDRVAMWADPRERL